MKDRYLSVERPDTEATVDFLGDFVSVKLSVERRADGVRVFRAEVKAGHGEEESTWDEREFMMILPALTRKET